MSSKSGKVGGHVVIGGHESPSLLGVYRTRLVRCRLRIWPKRSSSEGLVRGSEGRLNSLE